MFFGLPASQWGKSEETSQRLSLGRSSGRSDKLFCREARHCTRRPPPLSPVPTYRYISKLFPSPPLLRLALAHAVRPCAAATVFRDPVGGPQARPPLLSGGVPAAQRAWRVGPASTCGRDSRFGRASSRNCCCLLFCRLCFLLILAVGVSLPLRVALPSLRNLPSPAPLRLSSRLPSPFFSPPPPSVGARRALSSGQSRCNGRGGRCGACGGGRGSDGGTDLTTRLPASSRGSEGGGGGRERAVWAVRVRRGLCAASTHGRPPSSRHGRC